MENNKPDLTNPEIEPTPDVLKQALRNSYSAFVELSTILTEKLDLSFTGKYYRDSKAGLCKVAHKKKTIFGLSVGDGYFKTGFFFLERHLEGLANLDVKKENYKLEKEFGKMIPLVYSIHDSNIINDILKMSEYKKGTK